ncbi:AbrB family transcriptional regulator [Saccharopolyspora sp. 5N708]|uniref:AbrB family transcriptional regulator n=1 Tax=Saccharopolyspora sp. 5N708 TaxID=3457424 RepID=UPI003FD23642
MRTLVALGVGLAGGLAGWWSNLPAGPLLGSLLAVATVNVFADGRLSVPRAVRIPGRILVGATIGSLATPALLHTLSASIGWAIVLTVAVVCGSLLVGLWFARATGIDRRTALLGSCPGGMAEMVALAEESGARVDLVIGMHLVRKLVLLTATITAVALL